MRLFQATVLAVLLCLALYPTWINGAGVRSPIRASTQYLTASHSSTSNNVRQQRSVPDHNQNRVMGQGSGSAGIRLFVKTLSEANHPKVSRSDQMDGGAQFRHTRQTGLDFGELPTVTGIESVIELGQDALQTFYNLVRLFIDGIRPGPLPYELITPTVSELAGGLLGPQNNGDSDGSGDGNLVFKRQIDNGAGGFDVQGLLTSFATWFVPILVVTGLGIVIALLLPLCGCCLCCWRCCGKCGANNYKHKTKYELTKCIILSIIFLLAHLMLFTGIILGFLSNDKISKAIKGYPDTVRNAVTDSVNYFNGTINEVIFLADDGLDTVFDTVTSDIQNASTVLGGPLESSLQNELGTFLNSSGLLLDNLEAIHSDLSSLNGTITQTESLSLQLNDSLLILQEAIGNLTAECMGDPMCESAVPQFEATDVAIDIDTALLTDAMMTLAIVDINGTRALISNATSFLNNISGIIDSQLSNFDIPLNISQLDAVTSIISAVQQTVGQVLSDDGAVGQVNSGINEAAGYIEQGEQYRYIVFVILFVAIFFIWLVFTFGMLCGIFGYSRKAIPYERSAVSNCGARLLFLGVVICFLTGGLLLILTSFLFLFSSSIQKLCNDIAPSEYTLLQRLVDDPDVWGGNTLVGTVLQAQAGISANVSATEVLRRCEENQPLYSALQVDSFLDINALLAVVTNLTGQIDLSSLDLGSMFTYTSDDFLPASMRSELEDLASNASTSFNFTSISQLLNSTSLDSLNLQELSTNLTTLADFFGANNFTTAENETLSIRDNLVGMQINSTLMAIQAQLEEMQSIVRNLETSSALISPQVQQTFSQLDDFLNNTGSIVNAEVDSYVDTLVGYFTDFVDFALDQVTNEVGRCQPLTAAYGAVHNNFCVGTIDGVNGFWFSIGWCVLFLIPIIISMMIITTYFRKSKSDIHNFVKSKKGEVISNPELFVNRGALQEERLTINTPDGGW